MPRSRQCFEPIHRRIDTIDERLRRLVASVSGLRSAQPSPGGASVAPEQGATPVAVRASPHFALRWQGASGAPNPGAMLGTRARGAAWAPAGGASSAVALATGGGGR